MENALFNILFFAVDLFLICIGLIVYIMATQYLIAQKIGEDKPWLAWIPFANIYLLVKMARKPWWFFILFLIPLVNIVIYLILWINICKILKKPAWLGVVALLFPFNLFLFGYLAFSSPQK
ncbi:hypothetical protein HYW94_01165 [Candidatus Uhrbacteria bacterium]|nr:hypothetical protein [Candidatus Uhrbacteria bacterium]